MSVLSLTACRVQRRASSSDSRTFDTVTVIETLRDTVVRLAADSSMVRALLECDSLGQVHLRRLLDYQAGDRLPPPRLEIKDNVLTATASADSMAIYLTLKERLEKHISRQREIITRTVEVNRLTGWQKFRMRLGEVFGIALLVWLGGKIYKLIKS